ncbi:MAG TPA: addiction module protein [Chitinophagaceae bacterium]|jgi:putative addiction module component (TIGR02574 family)|nr:addiction module protein [Chitinophagaceae bacterium]HMU59618.1 addiction module protein [Chitinophagaceae bacterium]
MTINLDEIKKLSDKEKLRLIDEIWESIEEGWENEEKVESPETIQLLAEREETYRKGNEKSLTWDEVEQMAKKKMKGGSDAKE